MRNFCFPEPSFGGYVLGFLMVSGCLRVGVALTRPVLGFVADSFLLPFVGSYFGFTVMLSVYFGFSL